MIISTPLVGVDDLVILISIIRLLLVVVVVVRRSIVRLLVRLIVRTSIISLSWLFELWWVVRWLRLIVVSISVIRFRTLRNLLVVETLL